MVPRDGAPRLRVTVQDAWDEVPLDLPATTSLADLKRAALDATRVKRDPDEYVVKFRGFELLDESRSLADAGLVPNGADRAPPAAASRPLTRAVAASPLALRWLTLFAAGFSPSTAPHCWGSASGRDGQGCWWPAPCCFSPPGSCCWSGGNTCAGWTRSARPGGSCVTRPRSCAGC